MQSKGIVGIRKWRYLETEHIVGRQLGTETSMGRVE